MYSNKLKSEREAKKLTQQEIADILKIDRGQYGHYENEYFTIPIKHLNTLCNYFRVSIDYIFELSNKKNYANNREELNSKITSSRLKEFRKEFKFTQDKLAKELNISRTTITGYERGVSIIATPFLYTICKKYKISADYLLGKTDKPKYYN